MATADVARDLDLLRQAVGDRQLSYVGLSYGAYLGATYANLYPSKVRALVLDGVPGRSPGRPAGETKPPPNRCSTGSAAPRAPTPPCWNSSASATRAAPPARSPRATPGT